MKYPELTDDLKQGFSFRTLKYFGAGAIVASVTIGSGETLFASRGGAVFGYSLLWCFFFGALMKGVQVYSGARHMALTGEHPVTHWGAIPGPKNWVPLTIGALSMLCFPFWMAGIPMTLGTLLNWVFGVQGSPEELLFYARLWGTANIVLIVALTLVHSYGFLEKVQTCFIGIMLSCMVVAVLASKPDWLAALAGTFIPTMPGDYEPWIRERYPEIVVRPPWVEIVTYLGAIGGGTYDYIGYLSCFREKAWGALALKKDRFKVTPVRRAKQLEVDDSPENLQRAKRWLIPVQVDTGIGFLSVLVFTACFVILGAVILRSQQQIPSGNELLSFQAQFLTNLHPSLLYVYQIGVFFAIWGTAYAAYEIYIRTAYECLAPMSQKVRTSPYQKFRLWLLVYCGGLGLVLLWTMKDPVSIVTPAAIVGGVFTCGLWCFAMMWTDRHFLPKALQMGRTLFVLLTISGICLTGMGAKALWDLAFSVGAGH